MLSDPKHRHVNRRRLLLGTAATSLVSAAPAIGQTPAGGPSCPALETHGVPAARLSALARGFNLPDWMGGRETHLPDVAVLARLYARGFTHIRLPVLPERFMPAFTPEPLIARDLPALDLAVEALTAIGFAVSLDLHPGGAWSDLQKAQPDRAFGLLEALWSQLAQRYVRRNPERLFFEVLNEPGADAATWARYGARVAAAIRRAAPQHTIVYGPSNAQRIDALLTLDPLDLPNVVYAVHFYDPMVFTHQGLDWSDDPLRYLHDVPFPVRSVGRLLRALQDAGHARAATMLAEEAARPWTAARIAIEIGAAAVWSAQRQRPVILNEFGVLRWKAPVEDRVRWLAAVRIAAERNCIGWTHWDYADAFGLARRDGGRQIPDEVTLAALLG